MTDLTQFLQENPNWPNEDPLTHIINRDNWMQANRLDGTRILVLRETPLVLLKWMIHYYYPEHFAYEGGVYTDNKIVALKHYQCALNGYLEDEQLRIDQLEEIALNILGHINSSKTTKKAKKALQPELEKAEKELEKAKANLESMAINLVELARQTVDVM
jgi:hypothetical protein